MGTQFSGDPQVRVSDSERSAALAALGQFYAEGRLSMTETDERCAAVADARTRADLNRLFTDLPAREIATTREPTYTASEVEALHRKGARPRAGVMGLTTVAAGAAAIAANATTPAATVLLLAIIPVVLILLYVMKIGPASWYAPTPRQLDRERMKALALEDKTRALELKAERRERTHDLTNRALDAAKNALDGRRPGSRD